MKEKLIFVFIAIISFINSDIVETENEPRTNYNYDPDLGDNEYESINLFILK